MKKEYFMCFIAIFFWGTMPTVSKVLLCNLSNMEVLFYGSFIATITLGFILLFTGKWKLLHKLSGKTYFTLIIIGFIGNFLYSALYYYGLTVLNSQDACILNYLWPILTVVFSCLILKEKFTTIKGFSLVLSFIGVILITCKENSTKLSNFETFIGYICCILAAGCYGLFNVLNKQKGGNQLVNMTVYFFTSTVCAGIYCCFTSGFHVLTPPQLAGTIWLGVFIDAIAFLLWAIALQNSQASFLANFAYATPILSIILSAIFLHEEILLSSAFGFLLILGGLLLQIKYSET